MTRKDFSKIAVVLWDHKPDAGDPAMSTWCDLVEGFADILAADAPRFNREKFYSVCGVEADDV